MEEWVRIRALGDRFHQIRVRQVLSQQELADRAGVSKDVVCRLEQGARDGLKIKNLYKLAGALGAQIKIEVEAEGGVVKEQDDVLLLPLRRLLLPAVQVAGAVDETELTLAKLRQRVLDCTADYDRARYVKLASDLPVLVNLIDLAIGLHENEAKATIYRLLAHAYILTAHVLIQLRDEILAFEAVRRAMEAAEHAGDPLMRAAAAQDYIWAFRRRQMFDEAEAVGVKMAEEIGEPSIAKATPEHFSVWGRLLQGASIAAAQNSRPRIADELLSHAHSAAVRLSNRRMNYGTYWTVFGPATIAITRAENALMTGDGELAFHLGKDIRRPENLRLDSWTYHLLMMADAQTSTRDYTGAIDRMKSIRKLAPDWIKNHRRAHDVVLRLLDAADMRIAKSSGLAELAGFMGVKP
jgi:transcriptional regulator with XRE-family HTH domain